MPKMINAPELQRVHPIREGAAGSVPAAPKCSSRISGWCTPVIGHRSSGCFGNLAQGSAARIAASSGGRTERKFASNNKS